MNEYIFLKNLDPSFNQVGSRWIVHSGLAGCFSPVVGGKALDHPENQWDVSNHHPAFIATPILGSHPEAAGWPRNKVEEQLTLQGSLKASVAIDRAAVELGKMLGNLTALHLRQQATARPGIDTTAPGRSFRPLVTRLPNWVSIAGEVYVFPSFLQLDI